MVLNKSNNNKLAEYHGIFIPFQGQIYSKQGSHISLLFGTWMKPKNFYCWHWPDKLCWRSTFSSKYQINYVFPTGFTYTLFTKTSLFLRISLLKCLIYKRVNNLRFSLVQQFLSQIYIKAIYINFIRKKFPPSKVIYCLLPRKIQPAEKSCLPDWFRIFHMLVEKTLSSIAYVTEWSISIPSSAFSSITSFSIALSISYMKTWFALKINREKSVYLSNSCSFICDCVQA